jgi:TonB family protein
MKRTDTALTFALCASLVAHAVLGVYMLRERIAELSRQLVHPPLVEAPKEGEDFADGVEAPGPIIETPASTLPETVAAAAPLPPPPPPEPEKPKLKDVADENSQWGERDAKGFAITSSPGKRPMSAREGREDQAFASRDPEGAAREFPNDPSMAVNPPGQNGDGQKLMRDALAGKGTEGNPALVIGREQKEAVPPPPPVANRVALTTAADPPRAPETSGRSTSRMPTLENESPAEPQRPAVGRAGLPNDAVYGEWNQILPAAPSDLIAIKNPKHQAYPDVVEALTRPPGLTWSPPRAEAPEGLALPANVSADLPAAPDVQPATAALALPLREPEEMARRLGETDPENGPAVVEAMLSAPGAEAREGGDAPLPELALAADAARPEVREAIVGIVQDERRPEELAEPVRAEAPKVVVVTNGPVGSPASATGGSAGAPVQPADPAPDTGLESDPFAKIPGVEFRNGKVEARDGRQVKPVRPRLSEAGMRDLLAMRFPTVTYKVRIDKTGKVTDVTVVRGSGSEAIDMPVYRALWNWWFEPPKDKKGNPVEDVQLVSIHWG